MDRHFFGTKNDLLPGIKNLESNVDLKYVLCGLFNSSKQKIYVSILDYKNLFKHINGDHVFNDRFLVVNKDENISIRKVPQVIGVKYAIDQLDNPNSVIFEVGGIYKEKNLIHGRISTVSNTFEAKALFKELSTHITKGFKKIGTYYVGEDAYSFGKNGGRLITIGIKTPIEYDLRI